MGFVVGGGFAAAIVATRALGLRLAAGFCFHARHQGAGWPEPPGLALAAFSRRGFRQPLVARSRSCALANTSRIGQALHSRTEIRRTLSVTCAAIFSSRSRMVPTVACASRVPPRATTPAQQLVGEGGEPQAELVARQERGGGAVREDVHFLDPVLPAPSGAALRAKAPPFGFLAPLDSMSPRAQLKRSYRLAPSAKAASACAQSFAPLRSVTMVRGFGLASMSSALPITRRSRIQLASLRSRSSANVRAVPSYVPGASAPAAWAQSAASSLSSAAVFQNAGASSASSRALRARPSTECTRGCASIHAMISSRQNPLSARTRIATISPKRARMAATILCNAGSGPSLPSRSAVRNCAHNGMSPEALAKPQP